MTIRSHLVGSSQRGEGTRSLSQRHLVPRVIRPSRRFLENSPKWKGLMRDTQRTMRLQLRRLRRVSLKPIGKGLLLFLVYLGAPSHLPSTLATPLLISQAAADSELVSPTLSRGSKIQIRRFKTKMARQSRVPCHLALCTGLTLIALPAETRSRIVTLCRKVLVRVYVEERQSRLVRSVVETRNDPNSPLTLKEVMPIMPRDSYSQILAVKALLSLNDRDIAEPTPTHPLHLLAVLLQRGRLGWALRQCPDAPLARVSSRPRNRVWSVKARQSDQRHP